MAKIEGPLMSLTAHGSVGPRLTFSSRKTGQQVRFQNRQVDVQSSAQLSQREKFLHAKKAWNNLTENQQEEYNQTTISERLNMTGFNYFVRQSMLNNIIFEDTFESGNLDLWSAVGAAWSASNEQAKFGTFSAKGLGDDAGVGRILTKNFNTTFNKLRYELYFRATTTEDRLFLIHSPGYALVAYPGGTFKYYDGSYKALPTPTSWSSNTWYKIKTEVNSITNEIKYWIDDNYKGSHTDISFSAISRYRIISPDKTGTDIYIDNLKVTVI